jgi:tRNA A37 threonylcarbamoyladenosine dehydratase
MKQSEDSFSRTRLLLGSAALDQLAIRVGDLFATQNCRLARIMRKELRQRGVTTDVEVVYSTEGFRPLGAGEKA